ncbi:ral guanine nucleotide dissociation stimulator-like 3 isoform X2 [Erinaceus europaeus]|uniref:Ral guanine nucleotide dissociation stimulator-like 3 isoform X2 n=1 Tax=Erinaceus europaeus TaxID=9365 RepID=A0A1S2ZXI4_ERIEU|nr:ral guanine nucleotide dissociation stimulator-like 3 isoform X2 [Erinaceus europaeus]
MEHAADKELTLPPLQDWGEEEEDGAVYSVSLRRQRSQRGSPGAEPGGSQAVPGFLHYRTSKVRALRAAHLERLVWELVLGDREQDPSFVPAFLATHQAFAPTARVLNLLLPPPPPPLPMGSVVKKSEDRDLALNRNLRSVVLVLGSWLRDHPQDFRGHPAHEDLQKVQKFLGWASPAGPEAQEAEKLLREFLAEAEQGGREEDQTQVWTGPQSGAQARNPNTPEGFLEEEVREEDSLVRSGPELLDFSVDEVAEQLTLLDAELFSRVRACECLGSVWSQRDRPGVAGSSPTVRATVTQFNAVTGWVLGSVLGEPGLATPLRALRLEKWIRIAQRCRELKNFSSLHAILSALQSNPIYRLKRSWGAVSREPLSAFKKLSQIFSDENNYFSCREILSQEEAAEGPPDQGSAPGDPPSPLPPGPVPYLGTFLTDLVMLDTALPDTLEPELINFEKRRKEWEILARIQQLQKRCRQYQLRPHPGVLAALRAQRQLSEEQSYRVSRVIEPPAASCPSSPRIRRRISLTKRLSAKLSRERGSSPGGSPGDPASPTSSLSPGSPPASPRSRDPTPGSPPPSPGPLHPNMKLPLNPEFPGSCPPGGPRTPFQGSEARVIRVSLENDHGNVYRSILLTSQDKASSVVQRALQKHGVEQPGAGAFQLLQALSGDKELLIPENANVFYAMSSRVPGDFVLRRKAAATTQGPTVSPP